MDYCGHLMKKCYETKQFKLPVRISQIEQQKKPAEKFTEEENKINLLRCQKKKFYDTKICRHLCSKTLVLESTRNNPISPCESICFQLTRSFDSAGAVCPTEQYCPTGCPCPHYQCEKNNSPQKLIPTFNLEEEETISFLSTTEAPYTPTSPTMSTLWTSSTATPWLKIQENAGKAILNTRMEEENRSKRSTNEQECHENEEKYNFELITARWENKNSKQKNFTLIFTDFNEKETNIPIFPSCKFYSHERF